MYQTVSTHSTSASVAPLQLSQIIAQSGVAADLERVESAMLARMVSRQASLRDAGIYTVQSGGKRLRALLVLLSAHLGSYAFDRAVHPAVAIELLHAASLVHDDVVDHAAARRGRATVHMQWSRDVALALGDYLFGLAAYELAHEPDPRIIGYYVHASQRMVEGELNPVTCIDPQADAEAQYYRKIGYKTAVLFEAACKSGIAVCGGSPADVAALGEFGYQIGLAFQIIDDILDMVESEQVLGKPAGNDLREGTITLPLILAAAQDSREVLRLPLQGAVDAAMVPELIRAIEDAGGIDHAYAAAQACVDRGMQALAPFAGAAAYPTFQHIAQLVVRRRA
jgi:heptaprenyl diphosphate synthase/octaprenyl-diphosphate synthase